ncbi:hypothetical protein [Afipia massiliensis]|uniref:hypothetical protein n=1 Tax=Afipia massiliensis TaxID=211460 RepID=UPI001484D720|nr:hypothetical protein [Afipia massiliensis]
MSKRTIMMVGLDMPWPNAEYVQLNSRRSLLDGDIIVVHPVLSGQFYTYDQYHGKPSYNDSDSFAIRELAQHWKNQITAAFNAGKTIIVILVEREDFYIATGQKDYSISSQTYGMLLALSFGARSKSNLLKAIGNLWRRTLSTSLRLRQEKRHHY